jgi:hypothetical protein
METGFNMGILSIPILNPVSIAAAAFIPCCPILLMTAWMQ